MNDSILPTLASPMPIRLRLLVADARTGQFLSQLATFPHLRNQPEGDTFQIVRSLFD